MNLEKHNICLWNNGLDEQSNLLDLIKNTSDKGIKILSVKNYSIDSPEDQLKFCKAIYYKSETNFDYKIKRCGFHNFKKIEIELNCTKANVDTTRGIGEVSKEIFFLKKELRDQLNLSDLLHCTDTEEESKLLEILLDTYFMKQNEINSFVGIKKIEDVKRLLNNFFNYVVLRNFDSFYNNDKHGDVDILCDSRSKIIRLLGAEPVKNSRSRTLFKVNNSEKILLFDFREIDDNYYPLNWQLKMLNHRVFDEELNIYKISKIDEYYSLIYHAIIHKDNISTDYIKKINNTYFDLVGKVNNEDFVFHISSLKRFLKANKISVSSSKDQTVGSTPSNIGIFNNLLLQHDETHIIPSKNYLLQDRHAKKIISNAINKDHPFSSKSGKYHQSKVYIKKIGNTQMVIKLSTAHNEFGSRFVYSEHEALRLLNGIFCPKLYWYGFLPTLSQENNYAYAIIMEHVNGINLKILLENGIKANNIRITKTDTNLLKNKLAYAIKTINDAGIRHQDLRGESIIVDDKMNVKIIDFGLSRTSNSHYDNEIPEKIIKDSKNNEINIRNDHEAIKYHFDQIDLLISKL